MERKIIFLDIDGVLNCNKSKIDKTIGYLGIDDDKLIKLKTIIDKTGAEIVLCSSWKEGWFPELSYKYLQDNFGNLIDKKFGKFGLKIIDKTEDQGFNRGEGIINYIKIHKIKHYAVLDDEKFDYEKLAIINKIVLTNFYGDGLDDECVNKTIFLLNGC